MHRIPEHVDWTPLIGKEVIQVCLGTHQVVINFDGDISITIESEFEYDDILPQTRAMAQRGAALVSALGASIKSVRRESERALSIVLSNSREIRIHDANDGHESFTIMSPTLQLVV